MGLGGDQYKALKLNSDGSAYLLLEPVIVDAVVKGAKAERKTPAKFLQRVLDDWREAQADKRFVERMKKRKPPTAADYAKMTTHAQLKKDLGL